MNFSLKRYIKGKLLKESLNSDILINEIINDTGGFFRYYKAPYNNSMYERIQQLTQAMKDILSSLFSTTYQYSEPKIDKIPIDTDDKLKYVHKKYMEYYNKYMNTVPQIFNKVEPRIFISLISLDIAYSNSISAKSIDKQTTIDLFNISDDNFKTYYLSEFKGNKEHKQNVLQEVNNSFVFWIDHTGKIQAVSKMGKILLFAPDNNNSEILNNTNYKAGNTGTIENMLSKVSRDKLEKNKYTYFYKLSDGQKLEFPSPVLNSYSYDFDFSKEQVGINFLKFLDITEYNYQYKHYINVGKFYVSSSQIQKYTDWGKNEDDKVVIYKASAPFNDGTNKSKWAQKIKNDNRNKDADEPEYRYELHDMPNDENYPYGYNEYKQMKGYNPVQNDKKTDYALISRMKYKWEKDIFDRYKPYAGGKQNELFGYEKSLTDSERMRLYARDEYCSELAYNNFKNYRYQSQKLKTVKKVNAEIKDRLKALLNIVWEHVLNGQKWGETLKEYKGTPEFMEIMTAFDVYMKSTGYSIAQLAKAEKLIKEYLTLYNKRDKELSEYDKTSISQKYKVIITLLDDIQNFSNQLYDLENKINELTED